MGKIVVEGLGVVEIEGGTPTEEEASAIADAMAVQDDEEGDPVITSSIPGDQHPDLFQDDDPFPVEEPERDPLTQIGPFERQKRQTRASIEGAGGLVELVAEMTPASVGTVTGASIGSTIAPVLGTLAGGVLGGFTGELIGQGLGISPESNLNLGLAAAGPAAGVVVGQAVRLPRFVTGAFIRKMPFTKTALARLSVGRAAKEFDSLGTKILHSTTAGAKNVKPALKRIAGDLEPKTGAELYEEVRNFGAFIDPKDLKNTFSAIDKLKKELLPLKAFPEVKAAIKSLDNIAEVVLKDPSGTSFDNLVRTRQLVGQIVSAVNQGRKVTEKVKADKFVFKAISDDIDKFAASAATNIKAAKASLAGEAAEVYKQAARRAKLEFSVETLEEGVARFTKDVPEIPGGVEININGFQKWLRDITTKGSKKFDKNFTDSLGDEIVEIKKRLTELSKLGSAKSSPAGAGSLVIRTRLAGIGAIIGGFAGGGAGAAVGSVLGATAPEMIVGSLVTPVGSKFLIRAAELGNREISARSWMVLGQILARQSGDQTQIDFSDIPEMQPGVLDENIRPEGVDRTFIGDEQPPINRDFISNEETR
jgi:hypothetical protein